MQPAPLERVVGLEAQPALALDTLDWPAIDALAALPGVAASELDLAYVMYTSGSTGVPKGLMHTHYSGLAYARLAVDTYGLHRADRISGFAPLHVDQCTLALFAAPLAGAATIPPYLLPRVGSSTVTTMASTGSPNRGNGGPGERDLHEVTPPAL